jgi:hypothetical protein
MDTTVEVESQSIGEFYIPSSRVHNIGLLEKRRNCIILSCTGIVSGLGLIGLGIIQDTMKESLKKPKTVKRLSNSSNYLSEHFQDFPDPLENLDVSNSSNDVDVTDDAIMKYLKPNSEEHHKPHN